MGLVSPELSLDLKPSYVPETINGFLREVSMIGDVSERLEKVDGFVKKLEDEMKKIEVFKRELPLCMFLLKDAIVALKQELTQYRTRNAYQPVLEEFIPLKKESDGEKSQINQHNKNSNKPDEKDSSGDKKNWMSSVQLWSADNFQSSSPQGTPNQTLVSESQKGDDKRSIFVNVDLHDLSKNRAAGPQGFVPMIHSYPNFPEFKRKVEKEDMGAAGLSLLVPGMKQHTTPQGSLPSGLNSKLGVSRVPCSSPSSNGLPSIRSGSQQPTSRKQRRCWSPELHRRFVVALTQLGGPQVATPKQIRELMRVDGLTNDEVKSLLQKYRLHSRRAPNNSAASTNEKGNNLSGSWATQDQYSVSSKPSGSQSASPQGPLQFPGLTGGTSTTGGDSMEDENNNDEDDDDDDDDDDEKSESYSWRGHVHRPGRDDV